MLVRLPISNEKKLAWWHVHVLTVRQEVQVGGNMVQAGLGKNVRTYQKNNYSQKGWGPGSSGRVPV
jgi:hypothetical protein